MRAVKIVGWGLAGVLGFAGTAPAQIPGLAPTVPTVPLAAAATPAAAAPAAPANIWSFFCKTPEQKAQCKAKFCGSSIGQFINNLMLPASAMTGGLIGPCCPGPLTPSAEDLAKPATSAQGAAAKIKAEEAQVKAKIAAIEYLATVDCRYYPEAEAGMITGLRAEKNECVRLAAAKALASGCCCTAKVVKALAMSVNCSNKDGFPAEASELVRLYAFVALERCMAKCVPGEAEIPPEQPPAVKQALFEVLKPTGSGTNLDREILLAGYFTPTSTETHAKIFAEARQALARGLKLSPNTLARISGPRNLYDSVMPGGSQWRTAGPVVMADAPQTAEPAMGSPPPAQMPEPVLTKEPALLPIAPPPVATAPVPSLYREPKPSAPAPAWLSQRVASPTPEAVSEPAPARRSGRGNLFNIFQDASKR